MPLLAHYKLNGDANDASGYGHHGSGDATYGTGKVGQCGVSDGTKYLDVGTLGDFGSGMGNGFTIAFWFNSSAAQASLNRIMGVLSDLATTTLLVNVRRANAGDFDIFARDESGNSRRFNSSAGGWNDGVWHHVVIVVGTTVGGSAIYVDGVSQALTVPTFDAAFDAADFDKGFYLFAYQSAASARVGSLAFSMDDLRLYDVALSAWKVKAIYNFGKGSELCEPWQRLIRPIARKLVQPLMGA